MGIEITEMDNGTSILTYTCDSITHVSANNPASVWYCDKVSSRLAGSWGWEVKEIRETDTLKVIGGTALCPACVQTRLRNSVNRQKSITADRQRQAKKKQAEEEKAAKNFVFYDYVGIGAGMVVRAICPATGLAVLAHGKSVLEAKEKAIIELTTRVMDRLAGEDDQ